jgi:hypothetical protein
VRSPGGGREGGGAIKNVVSVTIFDGC